MPNGVNGSVPIEALYSMRPSDTDTPHDLLGKTPHTLPHVQMKNAALSITK